MYDFRTPVTESAILDFNALGLLDLPRGYLCQPANHLNSLLSGATGATLRLLLPTNKSVEFIALGLLGLPWGYLCQPANHWKSWIWGYRGYLGATFANQQII